MGKRTTTAGYWRQRGGTTGSTGKSTGPTPAVVPSMLKVSFDPTQVSAGLGVYLPKGARVTNVQGYGGATGGIAPTVDIGILGTLDGFGAELPAGAVTGLDSQPGSLVGTVLTADQEVYGGVGASAATGGTVTAGIFYVMDDDGSIQD